MALKPSSRLALGILAAATTSTSYLWWYYMTRGELLRCAMMAFSFWGGSWAASIYARSAKLRRALIAFGGLGTIGASGYALFDHPTFDEAIVNLILLGGSLFMTKKMMAAIAISSKPRPR